MVVLEGGMFLISEVPLYLALGVHTETDYDRLNVVWISPPRVRVLLPESEFSSQSQSSPPSVGVPLLLLLYYSRPRVE